MSTKVVLVEDKVTYRNTTKLLLRKIPNNEVVGEFGTGLEFLEALDNGLICDVVFMDIEMPELNGIQTTRLALQKCPSLTVIGLSLYEDKQYIESLIDAGAKGYLLKLSDNIQLIETIIKYPDSEIFYSKEIDPLQKINSQQARNVVLVDDVLGTRFVVEFILKNAGYQVYSFDNATQAFECICLKKPDIVLTDYLMPGVDGIKLSSMIKKILPDIPVVLLSGVVDLELIKTATSTGIVQVIKKPFTAKRLLEIVGSIVDI